MMVDVPVSRRELDFHGQDPAGLGVGVAAVGHALAVMAAYLVAGWQWDRAGGPDANLDAGDRFAVNVSWVVTFGAAEVVVLGACLVVGVGALIRQRTRFGGGVLVGWVVGLVLVGACGLLRDVRRERDGVIAGERVLGCVKPRRVCPAGL